MSDILTGTPAHLTYDHEMVRQAWLVVWAVVSGGLALLLGWMGLTLIVQEHLGRPAAGWREMVPRLVVGLIAAASSLWWCALVLDLADAVSGFIAASLGVTPGALLRASLETMLSAVEVGSVGLALLVAALYVVYGFFVLLVIVQMVIRLALIDILLALAPVALGLWILPHTAGWGRFWLRTFLTTVFQQSIQLIALALGFGFLNEFASIAAYEPVRDLIWKLLMSVAFVYLANRVPAMLGNSSTADSWLQTLYFGRMVVGGMGGSMRALGMGGGGGSGSASSGGASSGAASGGASAAAGPIGVALAAVSMVGGALASAARSATGSAGSGDSPRSASE